MLGGFNFILFWNFNRYQTENDRYLQKNYFLLFAKCLKMYSLKHWSTLVYVPSSRQNWDSPNPSPASECALPPPPPGTVGWGGTLPTLLQWCNSNALDCVTNQLKSTTVHGISCPHGNPVARLLASNSCFCIMMKQVCIVTGHVRWIMHHT
jgi:hypothetical protein